MAYRLIYDRTSELCEWAALQIGRAEPFSADSHAIGLAADGRLRAVGVYNTLSIIDGHFSLASDRQPGWLTRAYLVALFTYPFIQLRKERMTAVVDVSNRDSLRLTRHLGFREEGRMREAAPDGGDRIMFGMLRRECRFIRPDFLVRVPMSSWEIA